MARHSVRLKRTILLSSALATLLASAPVTAQSNVVAPPRATPPSSDVVGPPQLRDFNLNGTVTQRPVPAPAPTRAPPPANDASPAPERTIAAPRRSAPNVPPSQRVSATPDPSTPVAIVRKPTRAAPDRNPAAGAVTVDLPPPTAAPIAIEPRTTPAPAPGAEGAGEEHQAVAWWPWLAALLAAVMAAAIWWWRRSSSRDGDVAEADEREDRGAMPAMRERSPMPDAVSPPRATAAPRNTPPPLSPAAPAAAPQAGAPPAAPVSPVPVGVIASGLKPKIEFEVVPLQAEADSAEGAALTFDLIVINRGSAPARDLLIEAQLINAGPQLDAEVGAFFAQPAGSGERLAVIAPMGRVSFRTRLAVPGAKLSPLMIDGRKLLVPLVALNARYRWNGRETTDSMSFLIGRGEVETGKLAPFRLDRGQRSWSGLAARLHSSGLA